MAYLNAHKYWVQLPLFMGYLSLSEWATGMKMERVLYKRYVCFVSNAACGELLARTCCGEKLTELFSAIFVVIRLSQGGPQLSKGVGGTLSPSYNDSLFFKSCNRFPVAKASKERERENIRVSVTILVKLRHGCYSLTVSAMEPIFPSVFLKTQV